MICEVSARSVAHEAHSILEVCPCMNLSSGISGFSSWEGAGVGVGHLEKGFEEGVAMLSSDVLLVLVVLLEDVVHVDILESEDECRDFMEVRRKGREGRR